MTKTAASSISDMTGVDMIDKHFLDSETAARLVSLAGITSGDIVVDVGAGEGALLAALPACKEVVAVEIDPALVARVRQRFPPRDFPNFRILQGNALDVLSAPLLGGGPDVVVSNVPFSIVEPLMYALFRLPCRVAVLLVPLSFVDVLRRKESVVSLYASSFFELVRVEPVDVSHLSPPPDTEIAIVVLRSRGKDAHAKDLWCQLFLQRDKLAKNALREGLCRVHGLTKRESAGLVQEWFGTDDILSKSVPKLTAEAMLKIRAKESAWLASRIGASQQEHRA